MLERAAQELTPFLDEVAFVGGATIALWLTDPAGPKPRVTKDVDAVVEVATRVAWYRFEERLAVTDFATTHRARSYPGGGQGVRVTSW